MKRVLVRWRPRRLADWSWSQRFSGAFILSFLFAGVQLNWFGLVPGASGNLIAQSTIVALVGWFAVRVSPGGVALGLALALIAVYVDQATAGIGIARLGSVQPTEYWVLTVPHVVVAWMSFPVIAYCLSRLLPRSGDVVAVTAALLTLPFIRYGPSTAVVELLAAAPGPFVVLPVPWLQLMAVVAIEVTVLVIAGQIRWRPVRVSAVGLLGAMTLLAPLGSHILMEQRAASGIVIEPTSGGPLTDVAVRADFGRRGTPIFFWDGERIVRDRSLMLIRTGFTSRANIVFLPVTIGAGAHALAIELAGERRVGSFTVGPPGGLSLALEPDRRIVAHGSPGQPLSVYVDGSDGPELFTASFDDSGGWRSALPLPTTVSLVIVQSGSLWERIALR